MHILGMNIDGYPLNIRCAQWKHFLNKLSKIFSFPLLTGIITSIITTSKTAKNLPWFPFFTCQNVTKLISYLSLSRFASHQACYSQFWGIPKEGKVIERVWRVTNVKYVDIWILEQCFKHTTASSRGNRQSSQFLPEEEYGQGQGWEVCLSIIGKNSLGLDGVGLLFCSPETVKSQKLGESVKHRKQYWGMPDVFPHLEGLDQHHIETVHS